MKNAKQTLDEFGMDPKKIVRQRQKEVRDTHTILFDGVGALLKGTDEFCVERGYGRASRLYALQGAAEAALYMLGIAIEHRTEARKVRLDRISYDSMLFAALYSVVTAEGTEGRPRHFEGREMEATHDLFRKITGKGFRDVFIDVCKCESCKERRKEHGIKLNSESATEGWL